MGVVVKGCLFYPETKSYLEDSKTGLPDPPFYPELKCFYNGPPPYYTEPIYINKGSSESILV